MCNKCEPFGGKWMQTENGFRRCDCADGAKLQSIDQARRDGRTDPPVLSREATVIIVEMMAGRLNYFPQDGGGRLAVSEDIRSMCRSQEEAVWLAQRMGDLYTNWPGSREMRLVYCSKHRPLDGRELDGVSDFFPEGIPTEAIAPAQEQKFLPTARGEAVSAAESLANTVEILAEAKSMKNARKRVDVPDIPILPPGQRITQADIDAAVNVSRDRIAREELGL